MADTDFVWVVSSSNYGEHQGVEAVFSTPAIADNWAKIKNEGPSRDHYHVQCWQLDAAITDQGPYPGLVR